MQLTFYPPRRVKPRCDRGASGVEYALVLSLLLVGSSASFDMMDEAVGEHYTETANDIGQSDLDYFRVPTTTCAPCASTTTTTAPATTTTTSTTTTAPATTTSTSTTTTTTTAKPPTTTVATNTASSSFTDQSTGDNRNATAKVKIRLNDSSGNSLKGATVKVTMTTRSGASTTFTYTVPNSGQNTLTWTNRVGSDFPVTVRIESVTLDSNSYTPDQQTYVLSL